MGRQIGPFRQEPWATSTAGLSAVAVVDGRRAAAGRRTMNRAPPSGRFPPSTVPPHWATCPRTRARPRPVPLVPLDELNSSKRCSAIRREPGTTVVDGDGDVLAGGAHLDLDPAAVRLGHAHGGLGRVDDEVDERLDEQPLAPDDRWSPGSAVQAARSPASFGVTSRHASTSAASTENSMARDDRARLPPDSTQSP